MLNNNRHDELEHSQIINDELSVPIWPYEHMQAQDSGHNLKYEGDHLTILKK